MLDCEFCGVECGYITNTDEVLEAKVDGERLEQVDSWMFVEHSDK